MKGLKLFCLRILLNVEMSLPYCTRSFVDFADDVCEIGCEVLGVFPHFRVDVAALYYSIALLRIFSNCIFPL